MASTQTVTSVDPKYYVWWFPGSPVKVHLDLQLVKRLQHGYWLPGGPAEGGLLFGGAKDGCSEILDFNPSLCRRSRRSGGIATGAQNS